MPEDEARCSRERRRVAKHSRREQHPSRSTSYPKGIPAKYPEGAEGTEGAAAACPSYFGSDEAGMCDLFSRNRANKWCGG